MKRQLCSFLFWVVFNLKIYYKWSRFWRWALEWPARKQPLTSYYSLKDLEDVLGRMQWKEDHLRGLWDVISTPEMVERRYERNYPVGDCDEFASYAASRVLQINERHFRLYDSQPFTQVGIMTVQWLIPGGKLIGHNVCIFYDTSKKKWGYIGNWYGGHAAYDDSPFKIADNMAIGGFLVGYAVCSPDLRQLREVYVPRA